jgi:hypothetical protein
MILRPDPANPNRMDDETKAVMAKSLAEFGDMSGITVNRRTGLLIGGHQRTDVLKGGRLDVVDLPTPDPDGTVARGHLECNGRRYAVRVVDWEEDKAHAAMLAANKYGRLGIDDQDILAGVLREIGKDQAVLAGFDADTISGIQDVVASGKIDVDEKVEVLTPIRRLHVLISMTSDQGIELLPRIEAMAKESGAQVHHAGN